MAHEYAVLFAKHHREQMIEAVKEKAMAYIGLDNKGRECPLVSQGSVENAYKESEIV